MTTTTKTATRTETGDIDLGEIARAFSPCPECERRTLDALRRVIASLPEGKPVRWSTLRRRLPKDSSEGLEAASALLKLCDEGEAVLVSGHDATWVAKSDSWDRETAQLPRPGGHLANTYDYR